MNDKDEGESIANSFANRTSGSEGDFNVDFDSQITNLEDQLHSAQKTLTDLQKLKKKLEDDRKRNEEQVKFEKELLNIEKLKVENDRLKGDLKNYQHEITTLKHVITSLKDDLGKSAELFRSNVENSLRLLEKADHALASDDFTEVINQPKEEKTEIESLKRIKEAIIQAKNTSLSSFNAENPAFETITPNHDNQPSPSTPSANLESANSESKLSVEVPSTESTETASPAQVSPSSTEASAQPAPAEAAPSNNETVKEAAPTETPQDSSAELELSEYKKIQEELKALEQESLAQISGQINAQIPDSMKQESTQTVAPTPAVTPAPANNVEVSAPAAQAVQTPAPQPTAPPAPTPAQPAVEAAPAQTTPTPAETPPAAAVPAPASPAPGAAPTAPTQTSAEAVSTQPEPTFWKEQVAETEKPAEKPKEKTRRFLIFFKRKAKEPKESKPVAQSSAPQPEQKSEGGGKLLMKTAVFLLVVLISGVTYQIKNADKLRKLYTTQAEEIFVGNNQNKANSEIPDEFVKAPPEVKYKEAFVDAPFEETVWETHRDSSFGVKIDYPKNTSYRLKPTGSDNLWFLRKDGYLVKIEKTITNESPEDFWNLQKSEIAYKKESVQLSNLPALHLIQDEYMPVRGNIYLVKAGDTIFEIWYKTYVPGENIDDEKRVKQMLSSIEFISESLNKKTAEVKPKTAEVEKPAPQVVPNPPQTNQTAPPAEIKQTEPPVTPAATPADTGNSETPPATQP